MYGYAFTFEFSENARMGYIMDGAECVIDALLETMLTGRCEIFFGRAIYHSWPFLYYWRRCTSAWKKEYA